MWATMIVALFLTSPDRIAETIDVTLSVQTETVASIQIQGNTATPDEEVRRMADVQVGMPFEATTVEAITGRLRATKRFESVEVRKRFASIADPSQVALVIIVDEGPVKIVMTGDPDAPTRVARKRLPNMLILPILNQEDGYGITYGARLTLPDPQWLGKRSRVTFPLTWGGTKQAAMDIEKRLDGGFIDRVTASASISRSQNLAYEQADDRASVSVRGEHEFTRALRVGASTGWQRASFEGVADEFAQVSADVVFDTRVDAILARNAVYGRAFVEHLGFADGHLSAPSVPGGYTGYQGSANRYSLEGRGYLGFIGQSVLEGRVIRQDSDRPLPPYLQPQLGGLRTLRGFATGSFVGDTLVSMSAELVVPLTSPLKIWKLGVSTFIDRGTVYNKGETFGDQTLEEGYGAGVWFAAAFLRLNVAVAHGQGASTRVHVGGNVTF